MENEFEAIISLPRRGKCGKIKIRKIGGEDIEKLQKETQEQKIDCSWMAAILDRCVFLHLWAHKGFWLPSRL
jgi:hypothetical protein